MGKQRGIAGKYNCGHQPFPPHYLRQKQIPATHWQPPLSGGGCRLVSGAAGGSFDNERAPGPVPRRSLLKLEDQMKKKSCLLQVLRYTAFVKKTSGNRYKSLNSFFAMQKHSKSGPVPSLTARPGISARGPGTAHMRETSCASHLCSLSRRAQGA